MKQYKELPKSLKGVWEDSLPEGVNDTEIQLVDALGQKLDFRVGPVFSKKGIYNKPGIWIGVQRRYMSSSREVELLISPEVWMRLNKAILENIKKYNPKGYGPRKVVKVKT